MSPAVLAGTPPRLTGYLKPPHGADPSAREQIMSQKPAHIPVFSRYEVKDMLGRGGMGTVYRAYHEILNRTVAIKVPHPELASDEEFVGRFLKEARALGTLKHPHIVAVYDAGIENQIPYIVMECIEGEPVSRRIEEEKRLPVNEVVRWGVQMAEALQYLHEKGVLHRDLKSSNVLINDRGDAVLTDFGIAQVGTDVQSSMGLLGTPAYMSPEQAKGQDTDGRSDLYSLGIIMYEALTGSTPFFAENALALLQKVIHQKPASVRRFRSDVPRWLNTVIDQCLEKRPGRRYPNGRALAEALKKGCQESNIPLPRTYLPQLALPHEFVQGPELQRTLAETLKPFHQAYAGMASLLNGTATPVKKAWQFTMTVPVPAAKQLLLPPAREQPGELPVFPNHLHRVTVVLLVFALIVGTIGSTRSHRVGNAQTPEIALKPVIDTFDLPQINEGSQKSSFFQPDTRVQEKQIPIEEQPMASSDSTLPPVAQVEAPLIRSLEVYPIMQQRAPEQSMITMRLAQAGVPVLSAEPEPVNLAALWDIASLSSLQEKLAAMKDGDGINFGQKKDMLNYRESYIVLFDRKDDRIVHVLLPAERGWIARSTNTRVEERWGQLYVPSQEEMIDISGLKTLWVEPLAGKEEVAAVKRVGW